MPTQVHRARTSLIVLRVEVSSSPCSQWLVLTLDRIPMWTLWSDFNVLNPLWLVSYINVTIDKLTALIIKYCMYPKVWHSLYDLFNLTSCLSFRPTNVSLHKWIRSRCVFSLQKMDCQLIWESIHYHKYRCKLSAVVLRWKHQVRINDLIWCCDFAILFLSLRRCLSRWHASQGIVWRTIITIPFSFPWSVIILR